MTTVAAIDRAVEQAEVRDFDHVIRGSVIGKCERHLFYRFRWAHVPEPFSGRILRLFDTGQVDEARMIAWLRLAGIAVEDRDPATGEQWEVVALDGHFAGHLDGIAHGVIEAPATPHLLECKTHNDRSFRQLVKHGVAVAKPEHMAQMQIYMHLRGLARALYLAKNKDTDELHGERVHYDAAAALRLIAKAERIKNANIAPPRIGDGPDSFECKFCHSAGICHRGEFALRNCRTCLHSTPVAGGWQCGFDGRALTIEDQKAGCGFHLYLPTLVPGEQVDATADADTGKITSVVYRTYDGAATLWRDGRAERT